MASTRFFFILKVVISALVFPLGANAQNAPREAIDYLHTLSRTREALATTLNGKKTEITEQDFKAVCAPVGQSLKRWAEEKGYKARQVSLKNRNPQHAPNPTETAALAYFANNKKAKDKIEAVTEAGAEGHRVFARIDVTAACLHCHGDKNARPPFIVKKYPEDKAHSFAAGDLRGMYSVFIPREKVRKD